MATATFTIKDGKTLWRGVDYSNPSAAVYVGTGGEEVEVDDASDEYAAYIASGRVELVTVLEPTGDFSADVLTGAAPLTVQFANEMTGSTWWAGLYASEMVGTVTWAWDFGDSGTSTSENPSHEYEDPGTYTVTLTATNTLGEDDAQGVVTKTGYIVVSA